MIFALPFVQLVILVNAATMDMKDIKMVVIDKDKSSLSLQLIQRFTQSPFYTILGNLSSADEAENLMLKNSTDMILVIPSGFEKALYRHEDPGLQVQVDAVNGMTAGLISSYSAQIIARFNQAYLSQSGSNALSIIEPRAIITEYRFWFNEALNFKYYMVPGILAILLTVIGMFLSSLNLVREKEMGTIEQINVTPIRKHQFIIGKLLPFWIIAMFELALGLLLGKLLFGIPIEGSLLLLFAFAALYLVTVLGIGLLISTMSYTQQQAQFLNFFLLVTFVMLSGIFTPAESMPQWAQDINLVNPIAYFIRINRMILLKGSGFSDISGDFAGISILAVAMITLAIWRYRKIA